MSDESYRYPQPHPYYNDGPGPSRPSKRPRDQMSMSRLNNAASSSAGPSLILPTRNGPYSSSSNSNSNSNSNSSNNNNNSSSNMGSRPSLPPPTRSSSSSQTLSTGQTVIDLTDSPPPQQDVFAPVSRGRSNGGSGPSRSDSSRVEVIDVDALPDSPALPPRWPPMETPLEMRFARSSASRVLGGSPHFAGRTVHHHHHHHRQQSHGIGSRPVPVEPNSIYSRIDHSRAVPNVTFQPRFFQDHEDPILSHGGRIGQALPDVNFGNIRDAAIPPPFRAGGGQGGPQGAARRGVSGVMGTQEMVTLLSSFPRHIWGQVPDGIEFQPPVLDFSQRAPGIIREDSPVADPARARNIDYKSPPPAREGFTRSPKENDILVCAHCSSELGSNEYGPVAQEVWASKCGHSYCGTCVVTFRALPPSKSSTTRKTVRPKAKNCSVGCKVNLAAKTSMFKIHL